MAAAGRLGVRVRQRRLSRHRRHRRGRARAAPDRVAGPAPEATAPGGANAGCAGSTGMQSRDGGWGAFDADNTSRLVTKLPFCDFGAVIDPPSADVTAHVVEALAAEGRAARGPPAAASVWLLRAQETGRVLVRPLGCQLRLRHRRRGARADRGGGAAAQAGHPARGRAGSSSTRTPTAAGARTCAPTTTRRWPGRAPPPRPRPPGPCSPCSPPGPPGPRAEAASCAGSPGTSAPTGPGTSR